MILRVCCHPFEVWGIIDNPWLITPKLKNFVLSVPFKSKNLPEIFSQVPRFFPWTSKALTWQILISWLLLYKDSPAQLWLVGEGLISRLWLVSPRTHFYAHYRFFTAHNSAQYSTCVCGGGVNPTHTLHQRSFRNIYRSLVYPFWKLGHGYHVFE